MTKKSKGLRHHVKSTFVPHARNKYRPHVIKHYGLAVALFLILGSQLAYNLANTGKVQVLGYATNVSNSALLEYTNENRVRAGLDELYINDKLSEAARAKAEHMVANNYWSHYAPDGTTPWDFINKSGYEYLKAGENLAYGFTDSAGTVQGWMNSPPHAENIMSTEFAEVGFGMASGPDFQGDENTVVVAMYGQPIAPVAAPTKEAQKPVEDQSWTPQEVLKSESTGDTVMSGHPKNISVFSAAISGDAHWGLYLSLGVILTIGVAFAMRHLAALHQYIKHGEHYIEGHPMIEAGLVYGLIWLVLASTYGVVG